METNELLEEKAVEISVNGEKKKVSVIEGLVTDVLGVRGVTGANNELSIFLEPERTTYGISRIRFNGVSPVRRGDRIKAGLIVDPAFPKEAVYIALIKDVAFNMDYERVDCMRGYDLLNVDWKKMGLSS